MNSPGEKKDVLSWERSTWLTAATGGRKQTSIRGGQCAQGPGIEPSSSLWLCALPCVLPCLICITNISSSNAFKMNYFSGGSPANRSSSGVVLSMTELQQQTMTDRRRESHLHCLHIPSRVQRVSTLLLYNFQVLMSGASYLQIMKQQQVKPSESSTGSFQMLCIGLWLSATFYVNFDTLKSDVAHSCHLIRFNYVKVNAEIFVFHSPCCNFVCMFNYMFPHLGEVQVWSREQWKYVTCFCTKVLLHWIIKHKEMTLGY